MLWQRLLDWGKYLLKQKEQTEKNTADLKDQQQALDEMIAVLRRLAFDLERQRENEVHEREKLALRVENIILRERGLPPGSQNTERVEELLKLVEALRQENEELRKRLEQSEKE